MFNKRFKHHQKNEGHLINFANYISGRFSALTDKIEGMI